MPVNGMNVGTDYTYGYYDPSTGLLVDLGPVQDVKVKPITAAIKSDPINGLSVQGYTYHGYEIEITADRAGPAYEDMASNQQSAFNLGGIIRPGYITETVQNPDGSVSKKRFNGVVMTVTDLGDKSREKKVTQSLKGFASEMVAVI